MSSPRYCFLLLVPLWGALPLLIYVEGAGYMWSPIRIRTSLPSNTNWIQVRVLIPCKGDTPHAFPLKPAYHNVRGLLGLEPLRPLGLVAPLIHLPGHP